MKTYGAAGSKKLAKNRFNGERSATGGPLDKFDPEAIRKRHLTMATRHQKKERDEKAKTPTCENCQVEETHAPDPAYVEPTETNDVPF